MTGSSVDRRRLGRMRRAGAQGEEDQREDGPERPPHRYMTRNSSIPTIPPPRCLPRSMPEVKPGLPAGPRVAWLLRGDAGQRRVAERVHPEALPGLDPADADATLPEQRDDGQVGQGQALGLLVL